MGVPVTTRHPLNIFIDPTSVCLSTLEPLSSLFTQPFLFSAGEQTQCLNKSTEDQL